MPVLFGYIALSMVGVFAAASTEYDPSPNPKSVVAVAMQARFTVLTSHLIRMEWGGNRVAATLAFVNRNLPVPDFNVTNDGDWTVIETSALKVLQDLPGKLV